MLMWSSSCFLFLKILPHLSSQGKMFSEPLTLCNLRCLFRVDALEKTAPQKSHIRGSLFLASFSSRLWTISCLKRYFMLVYLRPHLMQECSSLPLCSTMWVLISRSRSNAFPHLLQENKGAVTTLCFAICAIFLRMEALFKIFQHTLHVYLFCGRSLFVSKFFFASLQMCVSLSLQKYY